MEQGPIPMEQGPTSLHYHGVPIPAGAGGCQGSNGSPSTSPFFQLLPHLAPHTSPSKGLGFGVGKMALGFSQIQYPLEPKPISLAQGPAIEGLSLLFKPPRAQLL